MDLVLGGVLAHFVGLDRRPANQPKDGVPPVTKVTHQGGADQTTGPTHRNCRHATIVRAKRRSRPGFGRRTGSDSTLALADGRPLVPQADRAMEVHRLVRVSGEVAEPLELDGLAGPRAAERRLQPATL